VPLSVDSSLIAVSELLEWAPQRRLVRWKRDAADVTPFKRIGSHYPLLLGTHLKPFRK